MTKERKLDHIYQNFHNKNLFSGNFIPGRGSIEADLFIIGEAPGDTEDKMGAPFMGVSGEILTSLLEDAEIPSGDVFITNLFKYRPPNNRDPFPYEIKKSIPLLTQEIVIIDPKVIVPMGKIATHAFMPGQMKNLVGKRYRRGKRIIIPTWHPARAAYEEKEFLPILQWHFKIIREALDE